MIDFRIECGWDRVDTTEWIAQFQSFEAACLHARLTFGKSWSYVMVTSIDRTQQLDVAWKHTHGDMPAAEWVTRALAPDRLVAIVSINDFLAGLQPQILGAPGSLAERPVWILINGMLYAPTSIGLDPQFGAVLIVAAETPSGVHVVRGQEPQ